MQHPEVAQVLAQNLKEKIAKVVKDIDVVVSPAMGGVIIGHEMGRAFGTRAIFTERVDGKVTLRRGFSVSKGEKVLVIDTDPQGNTTSGLGVDKNDLENTVYELILGECSVQECILRNVIDGVSVIPSNVNLAAAEIELIGVEKKEYILKREIDWVKDLYDYVLIDTAGRLHIDEPLMQELKEKLPVSFRSCIGKRLHIFPRSRVWLYQVPSFLSAHQTQAR